MSRPSCAGCGSSLRKGQWLCRGCYALAEQSFKARYPYTDPDSHVRNRNQAFSSVASVLALVQAGGTVLV